MNHSPFTQQQSIRFNVENLAESLIENYKASSNILDGILVRTY